jgi:hypothetical protein
MKGLNVYNFLMRQKHYKQFPFKLHVILVLRQSFIQLRCCRSVGGCGGTVEWCGDSVVVLQTVVLRTQVQIRHVLSLWLTVITGWVVMGWYLAVLVGCPLGGQRRKNYRKVEGSTKKTPTKTHCKLLNSSQQSRQG